MKCRGTELIIISEYRKHKIDEEIRSSSMDKNNKKPHLISSDEVEYVYGGGRGIRTPAGR